MVPLRHFFLQSCKLLDEIDEIFLARFLLIYPKDESLYGK
jgi:hypothetical protein